MILVKQNLLVAIKTHSLKISDNCVNKAIIYIVFVYFATDEEEN